MVQEIELYYLQSRYYDSIIGRFINGDFIEIIVFSNISPSILITNIFTYCENGVVFTHDKSGLLSEQQLVNLFSIDELLLMFFGVLAASTTKGLLTVTGYATKVITPIAIKGFWWKPLLATALILAAVAIVVGLVSIAYSNRQKEIEKARKRIPNKLIKNGKVDLSKFETKLPNGQGNKGPDDWKIVKDMAKHASKKWKLYKAAERIASLLEDGTIYGK